MRSRSVALAATALATAVVGCGSSHGSVRASCPTTQPGGPRPPRYALLNFDTPMGSPSDRGWYGNGVLWTQLPAADPSERDPRTGMLGVKMPWFRARDGVVSITGEPLSGPGARFSAWVGTPAEYGPTGFASSGLAFGRPGCWRLQAHLAGRVLTVVLKVRPLAG